MSTVTLARLFHKFTCCGLLAIWMLGSMIPPVFSDTYGAPTDTYGAPTDTYADMHQALLAADHAAVERLIDRVEINRPFSSGDTFLMTAAAMAACETVRLIIDAGADINQPGYAGNTALHEAALRGDISIAALLIESGADVNKCDDNGFPPLSAAITNGHYLVIRDLLEHGADPDYHGRHNTSALMEAIEIGDLKTSRILIDKGAKVADSDSRGITPLMMAVEQHQFSIPGRSWIPLITLILQRGAPVNETDNQKRSALSIARTCGYAEVEKLLLAKGADASSAAGIQPVKTWKERTEKTIASKLQATAPVRKKIQEVTSLTQNGHFSQALALIKELDQMPAALEYRDHYRYIPFNALMEKLSQSERPGNDIVMLDQILAMKDILGEGYDKYLLIKLSSVFARIKGEVNDDEIERHVMEILAEGTDPTGRDTLIAEIALSLARMNKMDLARRLSGRLAEKEIKENTEKRIKRLGFIRSHSNDGEGIIILDGIFNDEPSEGGCSADGQKDEDQKEIEVYFIKF